MRIGIDLGGTKIEGIALDETGIEMARLRVATPRGNYTGILHTIHKLIIDLENEAGATGTIGIGTPGSLNSYGLLRNSNTTEMNGKPFQHDMEQLLNRRIRISNDANCFALSEATDGAGAGMHSVFGVIIGTGTGGGVVIGGNVLNGSNGIGGEWGHNPLPWPLPHEIPGTVCYCGKRGCLETFLSGPALTARAIQTAGEALSPAQLISLAEQGHEDAEKIVTTFLSQLTRGLASVINVLDPDCVVLGGGLSNIQRIYSEVPLRWGEYIFSNEIRTQLLPAKYGDSSGVRGAAWLWN